MFPAIPNFGWYPVLPKQEASRLNSQAGQLGVTGYTIHLTHHLYNVGTVHMYSKLNMN